MMLRHKEHHRRDCCGGILVAVLVCLSVIAALLFSSLQISLRQRRQLDREHQMEQTRLLAEAGLVHAIRTVESAGSDFEGQSIIIQPGLDDTKQAEVKIEFDTGKDIVDVLVTAWIGLADRPETQTRKKLTSNVKPSSKE